MKQKRYTSQLGTGLGMIEETNALLNIWTPGMSSTQLFEEALNSGRFPGISARRLRNLISGCFGPRLLINDGKPAELLRILRPNLSVREIEQFMFIYTCRANQILEDFVCEVYWPAYAAGHESISNSEAQLFVTKAVQHGLTATPWSEKTIKNVAGYLTGACADFGILERGQKVTRRIIPLSNRTQRRQLCWPMISTFLAWATIPLSLILIGRFLEWIDLMSLQN